MMKTGKLDIELLERLLKRLTASDPRVIIGPKVGEDAAVIDPGKAFDHYWVVTADPITFTTEEIGFYGVVANMNDIATRGAVPKWFVVTLLFPEKGSDFKGHREGLSPDPERLPAIWHFRHWRTYRGNIRDREDDPFREYDR